LQPEKNPFGYQLLSSTPYSSIKRDKQIGPTKWLQSGKGDNKLTVGGYYISQRIFKGTFLRNMLCLISKGTGGPKQRTAPSKIP
jgi:hypothetical protein